MKLLSKVNNLWIFKKIEFLYNSNKKLYHLFFWLIILPHIGSLIGYYDYWAYITEYIGWDYAVVSFIIDFIILIILSIIAIKIVLHNLKNTKIISEAVIYLLILSVFVIYFFSIFYIGGADVYGGLCDTTKFNDCSDIAEYGNYLYYIDSTNTSSIKFGPRVYQLTPEEGNICSKYETVTENGRTFAKCVEKKIKKSDLIPIDKRIDRETAFYFSAITFLGGGYGEIYPVGFKKFVAIVEMFIGIFIILTIVGSIIIDIFKKNLKVS